MALAIRAASYVIAVSQATRHDLLAFYHLPAQSVAAISEAAEAQFQPQTPAQVVRVCHQYALPQDYVLYLGINKPHKNLTRLVEAWHRVVHSWENGSETGSEPQLVIAGVWDARYPECKRRVEELGLTDRVRVLGFVPDEDLPALYSGAMLFVFPSLYEGFGLPVLEAMSCGAPVVCSNTSSLPEIGGQAALTFDPLDVGDIAAKIGEALCDRTLREEMREAGLRRAAQFSWEEVGRKTLAVYRSVAHKDHPVPWR
jgi:glycosyltransferase involved in cell wall biosynthesis